MSKIQNSAADEKAILKSNIPEASQVIEYAFPENISLKNNGDSIEGVYIGVEVKSGEGLGGTDLIIAHFRSVTDTQKEITAVIGAEALKFLKNFKRNYYLKIIRTSTQQSKKTNLPFARYSFSFDRDGFDTENLLLSASEIPSQKRLTEAQK